jgi:hypothetical protein
MVVKRRLADGQGEPNKVVTHQFSYGVSGRFEAEYSPKHLNFSVCIFICLFLSL